MSLAVAFLTHAGPGIGLGHVRRCLALAHAWARDGAELAFVAPGAGASLDRAVPELLAAGAGRVDVAEIDWLRDPDAACARLRGADVAVVDSYRASPALVRSLAAGAGRVAAIDDLADRPLPAHVVINGGIAAESLGYERHPDTRYLLGPRYALIDPRFADGATTRAPRPAVRSVLVALGGAPSPDVLAAAVDAVRDAVPEATVDVVAGPFGARDRLGATGDATGGARAGRVAVHGDVPDMRPLMRAADLAVTGAGVTLYELAATGTPAVVVEVADNQAPNASGFAAAGAALRAGRSGDRGLRDGIAAAVARLAGDPALRTAIAARARELVDGRGALRAAREIAAMLPAAGRTGR